MTRLAGVVVVADGGGQGESALQRLQHLRMSGQRRAWHWLAEDLADQYHQVLGPFIVVGPQLLGSQPNRGRCGRSQRPFLISAEDERGHLLAARIASSATLTFRRTCTCGEKLKCSLVFIRRG